MTEEDYKNALAAKDKVIESLHHTMEYVFSIDAKKALLDLDIANERIAALKEDGENLKSRLLICNGRIAKLTDAVAFARNALGFIAEDTKIRKSYLLVVEDAADSINEIMGDE